MIRAIAIDDEPPALKVIKAFCEQSSQINLEATFSMTSSALDYLNQNHVDLLFLDINMPSISGIDFYKNLDYKLMVIFTTAYSEYAVEGFTLNAIDYLLKPIKLERFQQAVAKAVDFHERLGKSVSDAFYVKSDYSQYKILTEDVLYIEAYSDYIKIYRKDKKTVITRMTMKSVEDVLPEGFVRVHRSYIVSKDKVEQFNSKQITINNQPIPVGRKYVTVVDRYFTE